MTWTDDQLEEMELVEPFDKVLFLSGCSKHWANLGYCQGYVVTEENLQEFARLTIQYHENK